MRLALGGLRIFGDLLNHCELKDMIGSPSMWCAAVLAIALTMFVDYAVPVLMLGSVTHCPRSIQLAGQCCAVENDLAMNVVRTTRVSEIERDWGGR